ncbi:MAG TPA: class IV adenylate cyclase [Patescibacteria group bacterium]|nr:class IV adenylate cyclase [Patescibacteria group bacterium]
MAIESQDRKPATAPSKAPKKQGEIPVYELSEGLDQLETMVREKMSQLNRPVIVGFGGGSASGKTDAATKFRSRFSQGATESQSIDDYYLSREYIVDHNLNFDQPEAINLGSWRKDLHFLQSGIPVRVPVYRYGIIGSETEAEAEREYKVLQSRPVIVVDGLFALDNAFKSELDIKVFVDIGLHGRLLRRLMRDVVRAGEKPADILSYFLSVVDPMHEQYVEVTKANADMVIKNEYNPNIEARRSGLHEVQLKFNGALDEEFLRRLGAERLGVVEQVDTYYNPRDRDLSKTGESVRIREEAGHNILTYKGPAVEGKFRERPKFEFEIDAETKAKFLTIYGDSVKVIKKHRTLYQLDEAVISIDMVDGLGDFIEVRPGHKDGDRLGLETILEKLGLDLVFGIKDPYVVM